MCWVASKSFSEGFAAPLVRAEKNSVTPPQKGLVGIDKKATGPSCKLQVACCKLHVASCRWFWATGRTGSHAYIFFQKKKKFEDEVEKKKSQKNFFRKKNFLFYQFTICRVYNLRTYCLQVVGCSHKRRKHFSFTPKSDYFCKLQAKLSRLCQFADSKVSTKLVHEKLRFLSFKEVATYSV